MKKVFFGIVMLLILSLALTGCFNKDGYQQVVLKKGDIAISLDFSTLETIISKITVTATCVGYDPIVQDVPMYGKVAQVVLNGLAEGSWHIHMEVFDDLLNVVYTGDSDVPVTGGSVMNCEFIFEETPSPDPTGGVAISIVIKDFPDHILLPHNVTQVVQGKMQKNFYVLDAMSRAIYVYDGLTYMKMHKFTVPELPTVIGISPDESKIWVAFESGHIGWVAIPSGVLTVEFSGYYDVQDMMCFDSTLVIRELCTGISSIFLSLDITDGSHNDTFNMPYYDGSISRMEYNPLSSRIYYSTSDGGITQTKIHSFSYDPLTGMFGTPHTVDSDFSTVAGPLRFINGNTLVVTPTGWVFRCDVDELNDLALQSGMPYHYTDLCVDPTGPYMYAISDYGNIPNPSMVHLYVFDQEFYFHWDTIELQGTPKQIYIHSDGNMTLLVEKDGAWYFRHISWPVI